MFAMHPLMYYTDLTFCCSFAAYDIAEQTLEKHSDAFVPCEPGSLSDAAKT